MLKDESPETGPRCRDYACISILTVAGIIVLALPLAGAAIAGVSPWRYLEFPPVSRYVHHSPFSPAVFLLFSAIIALSCVLAAAWCIRCSGKETAGFSGRPFPWWGWVSLAAGIFFWIIAWNRFHWAGSFQLHTFAPLWITYVVSVNAITFKKTGTCLMLARPLKFLLLFPASALFWWFFEYLNRFVQNWHYTPVQNLSGWQYLFYASISFSTVLPSVLSTQELIMRSSLLERCCRKAYPVSIPRPRAASWAVLAASSGVMASVGILTDYLFPFLWVAPLTVLISLQSLKGIGHVLSGLKYGDWRGPVSAALAALCCGWFWEMWNFYSLAGWQYTIPFVSCCKIFEMPLLGYAGYLPFGLECAAAADLAGVRIDGTYGMDSS